MKLSNCRNLSRAIIDEWIEQGDTVVDATAGNGHDTLYLAQKVGAQGKVYAFDVQQAALDSTRERLEAQGVFDGRVELVLSSHADMEQFVVPQGVKCVLFNLGWLPSGDHSVTTMTASTLAAVQAAMRLIAPGGMVSICMYPGHEEGTNEKNALLSMLEQVDIREYNILHANFINQKNFSPQLILVQRENG